MVLAAAAAAVAGICTQSGNVVLTCATTALSSASSFKDNLFCVAVLLVLFMQFIDKPMNSRNCWRWSLEELAELSSSLPRRVFSSIGNKINE